MPSNVYRKGGPSAPYCGYVAVIMLPTKPKETYSESKTFNTGDPKADEKAAKNYRTITDAAILQEHYIAPQLGAVTFAERHLIWKKTREKNRKIAESTAARDDSYFKNHLLPYFGDLPIREVNDFDRINDWVTDVLIEEKDLAPATVHKAHGLLSSVLKECTLAGLLGANICEKTAQNLPSIEIEEMQWLDYGEVERLARTIDPLYAMAVRLACYTGLRIGELFGLQVKHLNFDTEQVLVRQQVCDVRGVVSIKAKLKTKAGHRDVLVPTPIMDQFREYVAGLGADDILFPSPEGGWTRPNNFRSRFWYPACAAAGLGTLTKCSAGALDEDGVPGECPVCGRTGNPQHHEHYVGVRIHDMRHTAATAWIDQGRHLSDIARMLGQVSTRLIDERYGHDPRGKRKVKADEAHYKLNAALAQAMGQDAAPSNVTPLRPARRQRRSA